MRKEREGNLLSVARPSRRPESDAGGLTPEVRRPGLRNWRFDELHLWDQRRCRSAEGARAVIRMGCVLKEAS